MNFTYTRVAAAVLFVGLVGCYLSLSSGSIAGQGYAAEEIDSGLRMLAVANAWLKHRPIPPMVWSRHGPVPVLFDLPFLKLGKHVVSPDFMLSFSPVLFTAGLLTILFLWLRKLCSPSMTLFLVLTAAFGTMLWPYAYIGLETKQSFFVLLAGYLALAKGKIRRWPHLLLFATVCALAISVKSTGITLLPVIAFLFYVQFRGDWRSQRMQILVSVLIIGTVWFFGHLGTNAYWLPRGGSGGNMRPLLVDSFILPFINIFQLFGSPTKGLLVYAPVLLASLYAVPRSYRTHRELAAYTLLVTTCTVGFFCLFRSPTDEVWGCHYLHLAIAPLILCIGTAWPRLTLRVAAPFAVLAIVGVVISFLGAFYYYGVRDLAMRDAGQNTLEAITGDSLWNAVTFNAKLFRVWLSDGNSPVIWTPNHIWIWSPPHDAPPWKSINLRDYSEPQSFMLRFWRTPKQGVVFSLFLLYVSSLVLGVVCFFWLVFRTVLEERNLSGAEQNLCHRGPNDPACGSLFATENTLQAGIPPSLSFSRIISMICLVAFIWAGGAGVLRTLKRYPMHLSLEREMSADMVLGRLHSADEIENRLQRWKDDSIFLFIAPQNNPNATKVYFELLILAYPRPISAVMCASEPGVPPTVTQQLSSRSANVNGLIFYDISPGRWSNSAQEMAPQLYLTSYTGVPIWESFCP